MEQLKKKMQQDREALAAAEDKCAQLETALVSAKEQLDAGNKKVDDHKRRVLLLEDEIESRDSRLAKADSRIVDLERRVEESERKSRTVCNREIFNHNRLLLLLKLLNKRLKRQRNLWQISGTRFVGMVVMMTFS